MIIIIIMRCTGEKKKQRKERREKRTKLYLVECLVNFFTSSHKLSQDGHNPIIPFNPGRNGRDVKGRKK